MIAFNKINIIISGFYYKGVYENLIEMHILGIY